MTIPYRVHDSVTTCDIIWWFFSICRIFLTARYTGSLFISLGAEIESEVDRLTRQVSGYERVGQSTPKYMATGERQSVGFPVDSGTRTCLQTINHGHR